MKTSIARPNAPAERADLGDSQAPVQQQQDDRCTLAAVRERGQGAALLELGRDIEEQASPEALKALEPTIARFLDGLDRLAVRLRSLVE